MLVKFAIDPQVLLSDPQPSQFDRLVDRWENYGVLVNTEELEDVIDSYEFNINVKSRLQEILKDDDPPRRFRFLEDAAPQVNWETLDDENIGRIAHWGDVFELAVLNDELAFSIDALDSPLSFEKQRDMCGRVEPIAYAIADRARAWTRVFDLSIEGIEAHEMHETLWNVRFSRLAEFAKQITIIDGNALRREQIRGLVRLLNFINRDGKGCHIELFAHSPEENDSAVRRLRESLQEIVSSMTGDGVQQVTVHLLPESDDESRHLLHDRYLRFDYNAYQIGNSIALIFMRSTGIVGQPVGFSPASFGYVEEREIQLIEKAKTLKWLVSEEGSFVLPPN